MPRLACRCGYVFDLGVIPNPDALLVMREERFLGLEKTLAEAKTTTRETVEAVFDEADMESLELLRCPRCSRLWLQESPRSAKYKPFVLEPTESAG